MRTIKFRAWDKSNNKMHAPFTFRDLVGYDNGCVYLPDYDTNIIDDDLVIELFTGLLDKNGKEIYGGDIVKLTSPYGETEIRECRWHEIDCGFWFPKQFEDGEFDWIYLFEETEFEVIGNIHQNPELL